MVPTSDSLSFAMARRALMQRYDGPVSESAAEHDVAASQMLDKALNLADDGSHTQRSQVTQALISQQVLAAQDVIALWPNAPRMQIAAAQMTSKARAFDVEQGAVEAAVDLETEPARPREVG